jgi:hypothetical protein
MVYSLSIHANCDFETGEYETTPGEIWIDIGRDKSGLVRDRNNDEVGDCLRSLRRKGYIEYVASPGGHIPYVVKIVNYCPMLEVLSDGPSAGPTPPLQVHTNTQPNTQSSICEESSYNTIENEVAPTQTPTTSPPTHLPTHLVQLGKDGAISQSVQGNQPLPETVQRVKSQEERIKKREEDVSFSSSSQIVVGIGICPVDFDFSLLKLDVRGFPLGFNKWEVSWQDAFRSLSKSKLPSKSSPVKVKFDPAIYAKPIGDHSAEFVKDICQCEWDQDAGHDNFWCKVIHTEAKLIEHFEKIIEHVETHRKYGKKDSKKKHYQTLKGDRSEYKII